MIFGKDYDTSLWFIMKADKKNRKEILEFIKDIPKELIENIRISLQKVKDKEFKFGEEPDTFYYKESEDDPRIYFDFEIDDYDKCLTISKNYCDGKTTDELFEIMLYPISREYIKECMDNFEDEWLGTITYEIKTIHLSDKVGITEENEREYNIYKTPFGNIVSYTKQIGKSEREVNIFKPIFGTIPDDIEIKNSDVDSRKGKSLQNKLIVKKKTR